MATSPQPIWLSLDDLAHLFGLSSRACAQQLSQAGLRLSGGAPSAEAIRTGAARRSHGGRTTGPKLWNREVCSTALGARGLQPVSLAERVRQWADLLEALVHGSPSISLSADQMAEDVPSELVEPVNRQLQHDGCSYRVRRRGLHRGGRAAVSAGAD
ncbi:hypothetical protein EVJ50_11360 [Synechococcus sp. RSCCF101]|uniref:hypothetical protein n=1 Tax=Synechococcus sp. RSCCF101 TaxID=2511069 RepID=UPI001243A874|nr:hypothetical protein [Synechococcus sp. RSCCF101]QEY32734.1 hypothetical protein EVJ50_11360 [Synechococcus sp. RSCCF101]